MVILNSQFSILLVILPHHAVELVVGTEVLHHLRLGAEVHGDALDFLYFVMIDRFYL